MKAFVKSGVVLAGYVAAVLVASAAVAVRVAYTSGPDAQASAGMYAFGDGLLFIAVFSTVAIFPTGLALFFLRPYRWFWIAHSIIALMIAGTAILSASVDALVGCLTLSRESPLMVWTALVLRMLLSPLWDIDSAHSLPWNLQSGVHGGLDNIGVISGNCSGYVDKTREWGCTWRLGVSRSGFATVAKIKVARCNCDPGIYCRILSSRTRHLQYPPQHRAEVFSWPRGDGTWRCAFSMPRRSSFAAASPRSK